MDTLSTRSRTVVCLLFAGGLVAALVAAARAIQYSVVMQDTGAATDAIRANIFLISALHGLAFSKWLDFTSAESAGVGGLLVLLLDSLWCTLAFVHVVIGAKVLAGGYATAFGITASEQTLIGGYLVASAVAYSALGWRITGWMTLRAIVRPPADFDDQLPE